jgi:hypothetical protein
LKRTTKYNLPLAEPTDKYSYAKDNEALEIIDSELSSMADSVQAVEQQIKEVPTINANAEVQEARKGFELLGDKIADMDNKINSASGVGSATTQEVVAARSGKVSLKAKIDSIDSSLADMSNTKVDKVVGKGLSTNDYDNTEKAEVAKVHLKADIVYVNDKISAEIASISSGTPEDFANLAAITAAYPTGDAHVKLNLADGYVYKWNGTAWVQGWVYQGTLPSNGSVGFNQMADDTYKNQPSTIKVNNKSSTNSLDQYYLYSFEFP